MLVEFALILPLLAMLLYGIISGGIAYEQKLAITHATREGARYGAALALDQQFTNGQSWAYNIQQLVINRASGDLNVAGASVCVSLVQGTPGAVTRVIIVPAALLPKGFTQSQYTTNQGPDGNTPTPCDTTEAYPTTPTDEGTRVQVRVSRPGKLEAVAFTMSLTLTANATSRYESTPIS